MLHLVLLWVLLQATFIIADEYAQLYYAAIGLPIVFFGLLGTAGNFLEGMGGWAGERLARLSRGKLYPTLVLFSALGFALSAGLRGAWGIPFIFLSMAAFYLAIPLLLGDLHRQLPSAQRATGESFVNLLSRLAFIPLAFGFGRLADGASIFIGFGSLALVLGIYLGYFLIVSRRQMGGFTERGA